MRTKKTVKFFSIVDYDKEAEYLRSMHKQGWKLTKITGLCVFHFEECEPEDVVYQLDYNKEGIENKKEYIQMFSDCGWEYLQDYLGYSYFRKPVSEMDGEETIFCDDDSRSEMLERIYKGRVIPLIVIFSAVLLPQLVLSISNERYVLAGVFGLLSGLYIAIFIIFALKYNKFKKK